MKSDILEKINAQQKPLALGIHTGHDASVAICSQEGLICVIQEERITRIKHHYGFPKMAFSLALEYCNLSSKDIDVIAFSSENVFFPDHNNSYIINLEGDKKGINIISTKDSSGEYISFRTKSKVIQQLRFEIVNLLNKIRIRRLWKEYANRHYLFARNFLKKGGFFDERIRYYYIHHHRAHASSAFRLSGLSESTVITVDGKGDGISSTIYHGQPDGSLKLLRTSPAIDSLGSFYQAITEALGFIPVDGEHKTMGLAALGDESIPNPLSSMLSVKDGVITSSIKWIFRNYNEYNPDKSVPNPLSSVTQSDMFKEYLHKYSPEQLALFGQIVCQNTLLALADDAMKISNSKKITGAGGVLLNVKSNALIRDNLNPDEFFIYPDASDSGLAAGAAMEALFQENSQFSLPKLKTAYLGHSYTDEYIFSVLENYRERVPLIIEKYSDELVIEKLLQQKVIGTFRGRMEMGPRALGNRSVLADPRDSKIKDRINLILKGREWFVPFAPVVLKEDAEKLWDGNIDYPFMTFAVKANSYSKEAIPAAVHFDGTMRPQVVDSNLNPWLSELLVAFKHRTGIGVLLNTSFNRHGLPIVGRPMDALDHLINSWIDGLVIGQWYVELKQSD